MGNVIVDSAITLNKYSGFNQSNKLDIVSDEYNNNGYTNFSCNITTRKI